MDRKFPDIGYFPEPPKRNRPLTVRNLFKLDRSVGDPEGNVGEYRESPGK
jgi:hypothetical protein